MCVGCNSGENIATNSIDSETSISSNTTSEISSSSEASNSEEKSSSSEESSSSEVVLNEVTFTTRGWSFTGGTRLEDKKSEVIDYFNSSIDSFISDVSIENCFSQELKTENGSLGNGLCVSSNSGDGYFSLKSTYNLYGIKLVAKARYAYDSYNQILRIDNVNNFAILDKIYDIDWDIDVESGETTPNICEYLLDEATHEIYFSSVAGERVFIDSITLYYS